MVMMMVMMVMMVMIVMMVMVVWGSRGRGRGDDECNDDGNHVTKSIPVESRLNILIDSLPDLTAAAEIDDLYSRSLRIAQKYILWLQITMDDLQLGRREEHQGDGQLKIIKEFILIIDIILSLKYIVQWFLFPLFAALLTSLSLQFSIYNKLFRPQRAANFLIIRQTFLCLSVRPIVCLLSMLFELPNTHTQKGRQNGGYRALEHKID